MQAQASPAKSVPQLDAILAEKELLPGARALLLLRVCQFSQAIRPEVFDHYWQMLREAQANLPASFRDAYEGLTAVVEPASRKKRSKFIEEILSQIEGASKQAEKNRESARRTLDQCAEKLRGRWWWPFGRGEAWIALVLAWAAIDREYGLRLMDRVPSKARQNLLSKLNESKPFSKAEWDNAFSLVRMAALSAVEEGLDSDRQSFDLSRECLQVVRERLLSRIHEAEPIDQSQSRKVQQSREKASVRYLRLVARLAADAPAAAEELMEALFQATIAADYYKEKWLDRFGTLRDYLNVWADLKPLRKSAEEFLTSDRLAFDPHTGRPAPHRDFALAQWYAVTSENQEQAAANLKTVLGKVKATVESEAWFLITLVRRGLCKEALELAAGSPRAAQLLPRVRRAILCAHPLAAATLIARSQIEGDLVAEFLSAATEAERVEWLRQQTSNGAKPLPKALWSQPSISSALKETEFSGYVEPNWYMKTEPEGKQFPGVLRLSGYGQYSYEVVDPILLQALVAWDELHPQETNQAATSMWNTMKLSDGELRFDLIRNAVFERCMHVLCAKPESFNRLFIHWMKEKLVDNTLQIQEGQTIYTLSLKNTSPFLYCLLAAQKLAAASAKRRDELLDIALEEYSADEDLMTWAAEFYSSDKGFGALTRKIPKQNESLRGAWQVGVVEAARGQILDWLVGEKQAAASA
jgi:hypothetical protein